MTIYCCTILSTGFTDINANSRTLFVVCSLYQSGCHQVKIAEGKAGGALGEGKAGGRRDAAFSLTCQDEHQGPVHLDFISKS